MDAHARKNKEEEERERNAASFAFSPGQQIVSLSSTADDATVLQKCKEKKVGEDPAEKPFFEKEQEQEQQQEKKRSKKKEKMRQEEPNMGFDVRLQRAIEKWEQREEMKGEEANTRREIKEQHEEDHHPQEENPQPEGEKKRSKKKKKRKEEPNMHREVRQQEEDQNSPGENPHTENSKGDKKRIKKKKRKEDPNMDFDISLHREIEKHEQQEEDQHSQEENLPPENSKGEKKRSKKKEKKRKEEVDQHSDEGNLLRGNREERRSKKEEEEEEKAETPSQKILTQSSFGDHEQGKIKKARKLLNMAKENGHAKGVVYEDTQMAKKAKQAQDILCKSVDEEGSNHFVKEDDNVSSKAMKHSKKSRSSVERGSYEPPSTKAHDLLSNSIECSKEPLSDQIEHVTNSSGSIDSSPKEKEKEKKKQRKRKRVTFQDQINVANQEHVRDVPNAACESLTETVEEVWGSRFTPEEDEILKDAVWKYIKSKGWDEQEGLKKVFNSKKHQDAHNCWADIKFSLPHRPRASIRYRAHVLLEKGAHLGKWSEEEVQLLQRLQEEHGHKWREISSLLDRHRTSIKEKWRSLKRTKGTGVWTQGELQQLSDMVHKCLRAKASITAENKNPDRHILRDNINWEKIADTLGTHNHGSCCGKWYYNLQSSLVTDGLWANEDDFLLLQSLLESGACVEEEVEWDSLLDHRSGQVCSTRWKQMVKHLGENRTRQFLDKLDILASRYAPELLESSVN